MKNKMYKKIEDDLMSSKLDTRKIYQISLMIVCYLLFVYLLFLLKPLKDLYIIDDVMSFPIFIMVLGVFVLVIAIAKSPYGKISKPNREQIQAKAEKLYPEYQSNYEKIGKSCRELVKIIDGRI